MIAAKLRIYFVYNPLAPALLYIIAKSLLMSRDQLIISN